MEKIFEGDDLGGHCARYLSRSRLRLSGLILHGCLYVVNTAFPKARHHHRTDKPLQSAPQLSFSFSRHGFANICKCFRTHEKISIGKAMGSRPRVLSLPTVGPPSLCHRCSQLRERLLNALPSMEALRDPRPRGETSQFNLEAISDGPRVVCGQPAGAITPVCVTHVLKPCTCF